MSAAAAWRSGRIAVLLLCFFIPALIVRAAPPLSLYGNLPGFEMAAISASGRYIALIGVLKEQRRLIVVDEEAQPVFAAPLGDLKVRGINWAGDGKILVHTSATVALGADFTASKAELSSMIVVSVPDGKSFSVFQTNPFVTGGVRGYYGAIRRAGHWYGYFGSFSKSKIPDGGRLYPDLFEVDLDNGRSRQMASRDPSDVSRDWVIDAEGKIAGRLDVSPNDGRWSLRGPEGRVLISGRAPQGDIELVGLGRKPGTLTYIETDVASGRQKWLEISSAGGAPTEIAPEDGTFGSYVDDVSRLLIGYGRDGDLPQAVFFDPERQKVVRRVEKAFPGRSVAIVDWSDAFDRLIVRTEGIGDPQNWWIVDVKGRNAKPLGSAYPLVEADIGPVRMVRYKATDGLDIAGVLTLPPGRPASKLPVVVLPHGGPGARDYPEFNWWAQAFASRGYAVFQPNFRGSTGYGAAFKSAGRGEWGRKMQSDMSDGLAFLASEGVVDPRRACIMGASYGGYAALAGVTLQQGLYRCAVSFAGVSDLGRFYQQQTTQNMGARTIMESLKAEIGYGKDLKMVSPLRFAAAADAPILLIHGKDDVVVPFDQSRIMADALKDAGKTFEFYILKDEDHWLSRSATRQQLLTSAMEFVQKYNPPDPPPSVVAVKLPQAQH